MTQRTLKSAIDSLAGFGLRALSEDQLEAIHCATLEILAHSGIRVEDEEAMEIYHGGGAVVERGGKHGIVRLPSYLVEECIRSAPHTITCWARDPNLDFLMEPKRVGFTNFGECTMIIDPETGERRPTCKDDCARIALVDDALEQVNVVQRSVNPADVPGEIASLHILEAYLKSTSKHIFMGVGSGANVGPMVEMAAAAVGGLDKFKRRPLFTANVCPTTPLTLCRNCCTAIVAAVRHGLGVNFITAALSGGTAPATLAGTMAVHNAEVLGGIVLAQLVSRGSTCVYGGCSTIMDLRFATPSFGAPEFGILNAAAARMAQYYRLPCFVGAGPSDSKVLDIQAGYEFGLNVVPVALAGANLIFSGGALEQGLTFDLAKLVLDAEMFGLVRNLVAGMVIDDDNMALDVIHEVGPGGQFVTHDHTRRNMRRQSQTRLFDRRTRADWLEATGGRDIEIRAAEKVRQILAEHRPLELPAGAAEVMAEIIKEREAQIQSRPNRVSAG